MFGAANTILELEAPIDQVLSPHREPRIEESFFEPFNSQSGDAFGRRRGDKADPSMPQFEQMVSGGSGDFRFPDRERDDPWSWFTRTQPSDRHVTRCQLPQHRFGSRWPGDRRNQDPGYPMSLEEPKILDLLLAVLVRITEKNGIAFFVRGILGAADEFWKERIGDRRNDDPHRMTSLGAQTAGNPVRPIVQVLNGL